MEVIADYPAAASASGKNAYYLGNCECVGHRPSYAACLNKIELRKAGRLSSSLAECSAAINRRECPAQRLRDEELSAGKAIYFIDRAVLTASNDERTALESDRITRLMAGERPEPARRPARKTTEAAPAAPAMPTYADAINAALKEARSAPTAAPKPIPKPAPAPASAPVMKLAVLPMLPGESMADYARRVMAARAS
jgi:hypothetical protein